MGPSGLKVGCPAIAALLFRRPFPFLAGNPPYGAFRAESSRRVAGPLAHRTGTVPFRQKPPQGENQRLTLLSRRPGPPRRPSSKVLSDR